MISGPYELPSGLILSHARNSVIVKPEDMLVNVRIGTV